jgi:hypothetical protein
MGFHRKYESKNQQITTTYIDGIVVDGSNILYTMVPEGEFGFTKLMTNLALLKREQTRTHLGSSRPIKE